MRDEVRHQLDDRLESPAGTGEQIEQPQQTLEQQRGQHDPGEFQEPLGFSARKWSAFIRKVSTVCARVCGGVSGGDWEAGSSRQGLGMAPTHPRLRLSGCFHLGGAPFAHAFGDDFD